MLIRLQVAHSLHHLHRRARSLKWTVLKSVTVAVLVSMTVAQSLHAEAPSARARLCQHVLSARASAVASWR